MKELVCIVGPRGCTMTVEESDGEITVKGNGCKRGKAFAESEIKCPTRTICSTVYTVFEDCPVLPVRVSKEIPKERIFDVMAQINSALVEERIGIGDTVIKNVCGLDADVIATSDILRE